MIRAFQLKNQAFRAATGHVRMTAAGNDGDTITVVSAGVAVIYELDNNAAVTAGNVPVTIGGTAALTAAALLAAITANQAAVRASQGLAPDNVTVDLLGTDGAGLTVSTVSGGRAVVQDNADEIASGVGVEVYQRIATVEDVARGVIDIKTPFTAISKVTVTVIASATNDNTPIAWTGNASIFGGGVVRLDNSGGTDWAFNNAINVVVTGRY